MEFGIVVILWLIYALYLNYKVMKLKATRKVKRIAVVRYRYNYSKFPVVYCLNVAAAKQQISRIISGRTDVKENDLEIEWADLKYPSEK